MQKYENKVLHVDVSDGKANYSQRNNQYIHKNKKGMIDVQGSTMCNVTSICMALDYNGWQFPKGPFAQPEDNLCKFLMESKEVDEYYKKVSPNLYKDYKDCKTKTVGNKVVLDYYTPNEIHLVLAYATNLWLKSEADSYSDTVDIFDIISELLEGRSCVISGNFNGLGHIVTLVGCEWNVDSPKSNVYDLLKFICEKKVLPNRFIIDDPYGKWNAAKGYASGESGNNSLLTRDEFMKMIKPENNQKVKRCHKIKLGSALV